MHLKFRTGFKTFALMILSVAIGGCRPTPPTFQLELYELREELREQEAFLFFPDEFEQMNRVLEDLERSSILSAEVLQLRDLSRILEAPLIESRIEMNVLLANHLLDEIRKIREEFEADRLDTVALVRSRLQEMGPSLQHPELQPLLEKVEDRLGGTETFLKPGRHEESVRRLKRLTNSYAELHSRWIRYHGGPIAAGEFQEAQQSFQQRIEPVRAEGLFLVIDTALNRFYLKDETGIVLEGPCSTGSRRILESPAGRWTFETPRGEFRIQEIVSDPAWRRPDWAFLEEGQPIPTDERKRWVRGALGEYALGLGGSHYIHGTEYTRLLGFNVTHGCIRMGGEDLARVAELVSVGTTVYVF